MRSGTHPGSFPAGLAPQGKEMTGDKNNLHLPRLVAAVLPLLIVAAVLTGAASGATAWDIQNPYAGVDWDRYQQHKANFHTHTTMSDGRSSPREVIDRYSELGYAVLALTDHDTVGPRNDRHHPESHQTTWPWQAHGRDPEIIGMVAIEGNEISRWHHIGSYFNNYGDAYVDSEESALKEIGRRGGLAVLFHPGRHKNSVEWYSRMYRQHSHLIGLEVYNQRDRYPGDRKTWDAILTSIGGERPVWGFANDDMHNPESQLGRSWNILLLPELSAEWVRRSMESGAFFFVHAPDGHEGAAPPVIRAITVDSRTGAIHIDAAGHEKIEWISEGRLVHRGERVTFSELAELAKLGGYIRAVVHAAENGPVLGTQPFRLTPPGK
jgi:hypothetical protein